MRIFDRPIRLTVAILWFVGAGFAVLAAVLSSIHPGAGPPGLFLVAAGALTGLGCATFQSRTWAIAVSLVLLAGQVIGVAGSTLQLAHGIDPGKAAELRALGFEPRVGIAVNLVFSLIATTVLAAAIFRARVFKPER